MDYAITLVAAVLLGVGFVLQQQTAETAPQSHFLSPRLFLDLFKKRKWLAGIGCMIAGQVLAAWSLGHLSLGLVEPLLTFNLLVALILAVPISHQPVRITEIVGALVLIAGETILSLARVIQPIGQSFGSFSHWPGAGGIALIAFAAVQAGRRRSGKRRATWTGLGAGLVFGIQDALTRQTLQILQNHGISGMLQSWSAYCLVATGAVGILLMQSAFNSGPLHASLPTITAGEPVAGILLGIIVFGDRISLTPGSLALQAGGLFALVLGVVLVARAPALDNLRKAVAEPGHLPRPHLRDTGPHRALRSATEHLHVPQVSREPQVSQGPQKSMVPGPGQGPSPGQGTHPGRRPRRGVASRSGDIPRPGRAVAPRIPDQASPTGSPGSRLPGAPAPGEPPESLDHSGTASFALPTEPPTPVPPDPPRLAPFLRGEPARPQPVWARCRNACTRCQ
ncbi:MAG: DMT family transporter [Streptosporangiaceae bacterium]